MLSPEQESFLTSLADKSIAEEKAIKERNDKIVLDGKIQAAREIVLANLNAQAQTLIDKGLADFELNIVPTIK